MSGSPVQYARNSCRTASVRLGWKPRRSSSRTVSNDWLKIYGHVTAPDGRWSFTDQSLTVDEVAQLTGWLRALAAALPPPELKFIEPNLEFATAADPHGPVPPGLIPLRICFRGEVAPPWIWHDPDAVWRKGYWLELLVSPRQVQTFAAALDRLMGR
jgi:hypothetical protein